MDKDRIDQIFQQRVKELYFEYENAPTKKDRDVADRCISEVKLMWRLILKEVSG